MPSIVRFRYCLAILLLPSLSVRAQSDFRPGYIVPLSGDTLRGLVDYQGFHRSGLRCLFRPEAGAAVQTFSPEALRAYGFADGMTYYRAVATPERQAATPPALEPARLTTYFLQVLVAGKGSLFRWRDAAGTDRFYVQLTGQPVQELVQQLDFQQAVLGQAQFAKRNLYRATLGSVFADCPAVLTRVGQVPFTARALSQFVRDYNSCQGEQTPLTLPPPTHLQIGVVAGGQVSALRFGGSEAAGGQYTSTVGALVGIGGLLPLANLSSKLALCVEVLYERQTYRGTFAAPYRNGYYPHYRQYFAFRQLHVPVMLRYTWPHQRAVGFFGQVGASYAQVLRRTSEQQVGYSTQPDGAYTYGPVTPALGVGAGTEGGFRSFELGLVAGIGLTVRASPGHQFSLEGRARLGTGPVYDANTTSRRMHYAVLLGYNFTK